MPSCRTTPSASADVTRVSVRSSTPRRTSWRAVYADSRGLNAGEDAVTTLEQEDAHRARRELRILLRHHQAHELGERARVLDAGRSGADDAEGEERLPLGRVGVRRRALEAREHVVAQLQRLGQVLEAERVLLDRRVAVVVRDAPGGDDARVVLEHGAAREGGRPGGVIERDHLVLAVPDVGAHRGTPCGSARPPTTGSARSSPPGTAGE